MGFERLNFTFSQLPRLGCYHKRDQKRSPDKGQGGQKAGDALRVAARCLDRHLAFRAGEVVTRMEIWNHVYDEYEDSSSNAVDVYVGYLRKKLNSGDLPNLIQTRRGVGYYLGVAGP